jgi:hypothetical protein
LKPIKFEYLMIDLQLTDKKHDEERQGEALILGAPKKGDGRKLYIESYGCQMNFADSEIVASILADTGFENDWRLSPSRCDFYKHLLYSRKRRTTCA